MRAIVLTEMAFVVLSASACGADDNNSAETDTGTATESETESDTTTDTGRVPDTATGTGEAPDTATGTGEAPDTATGTGEAPDTATDTGEAPDSATGTGTGEAPDTATDSADAPDTATGMVSDTASDTDEPPPCGLAVGGPPRGTHVLRFEGIEDPSVQVYLERVYEDWGIGESVLFGLTRMIIEMEGGCIVISDPGDLEYGNTHHNWFDIAFGNHEGVRYELEMLYSNITGARWECSLSAVDAESNDPIFPPVDVIATGGPINLFGYQTPWHLPVNITEFMADNTSTWQDDAGDFDPWIELFNPSSGDVDLSGYYLSNDTTNRTLWAFPEGTLLPRHEYLLIAADGETTEGPLHTNFALSPASGVLMLSSPDNMTSGEREYGPQSPDESMVIDYADDRYVQAATPTPGTEN